MAKARNNERGKVTVIPKGWEVIHATAKQKPVIAMVAPVAIQAASDEEGSVPTFDVTAYNGGALNVGGYDNPVVIDLAGMSYSRNVIANLDHEARQRVGQVKSKSKEGGKLQLSGVLSAATPYRAEVINSMKEGWEWEASIEAQPTRLVEIPAGKEVEANGQTFTGPLYLAKKSTLTGFAFVSQGADSNTTVSIAATAEPIKGKNMKKEVKAWAESMGVDCDNLTDDQIATIEANYAGANPPKPKHTKHGDVIGEYQAELEREEAIANIVASRSRGMGTAQLRVLQAMADDAVATKMSAKDFELKCYRDLDRPRSFAPASPNTHGVDAEILEAAILQAGMLPSAELEKSYSDQVLQAAHDRFKGRIGLKQLFLLAAEANSGHTHSYSSDVGKEVLRAAFNPEVRAGFSTLDISTIVSNTANKMIMRGWNMGDRTCLNIAKIQNVRDFKTHTTVSLTDSVIYEKLGAGGEIKHGTLSELTYTNKADTYAKMLAITRNDIINDDLGALTDVPMKLGNGALKKLNDIFWTEFLGLVSASFFASGNSNINTGVATVSTAGMAATETIFMNQTNPDGTPLGIMPAIMLVPTALKSAALELMTSERVKGDTDAPDANVWRGRFRVESSPYISNSSYTGNTSVGWWLLADPNELPVISIAALNGQVTPTVDTAEADFNVLGVQMRGYADVGVSDTEYRGGVYADGGAS